jgi:hypothetical protein
MAYSDADLDLAERLIGTGRWPEHVAPSLAERIRKWNGRGVIAPPGHHSLGQGRGSASEGYSAHAEKTAEGMLDALRTAPRPLYRTVLVAWWRGVEVGDRALREALTAKLRSIARLARERPPIRGTWPGASRSETRAVVDTFSRVLAGEHVDERGLARAAATIQGSGLLTDIPAAARTIAAARDMDLSSVEVSADEETALAGMTVPDLNGRQVASLSFRDVMSNYNVTAGLAAVAAANRDQLDRHRDTFKGMVPFVSSAAGAGVEDELAALVPIMFGALDALDELAGRRPGRRT